MISKKFASLSDDQLLDFLTDNDSAPDTVTDSVESVSDLWTLANMQASYDRQDEAVSHDADFIFDGALTGGGK